MATVLRVNIFRPAVDELLHGRTGPVVLHQANLGRQAAGIARRIAPRSSGPSPHLADNISSKLVPSGRRGYDVQLTAAVPWAIYVHRGTRPHSIGSPVMVAPGTWRYIGLSPAGRGKIHPGTKANKFLLEAVRQVGLDARETRG